MPYRKDSPPAKLDGLPDHAKEIWIAAFNNAFKEYKGDEGKSQATAWAAVKAKYEQDQDGNWHAKKEAASSERVAFDVFKAADYAKPFKILPIGTFFRDDRTLTIDDQRAQAIVANFESGLPRYQVQVNIEHGEELSQPGSVGIIKKLRYVPGDGVYADQAEWTEVGKQLLDEDRYQGVSPEMMWTLNSGAMYQDPETGKWLDNVLVGLALTTTPFFGKAVQTFSAKPGVSYMASNNLKTIFEQFAAGLDNLKVALGIDTYAEWTVAEQNDLPDSSFAYIESGGSKDSDGKTTPRSLRHLPYKDKDGKVDLPHLRNALARLNQADISAAGKAEARRKLEAAAKAAGVGEADKGAANTASDKFDSPNIHDVHVERSSGMAMQHEDMTKHHGSDGRPDEEMCAAALKEEDLSAEEKQHLQEHLAALKAKAKENDSVRIKAEEFNALKQKAAEVETLSAQMKSMTEQFAAERRLRQLVEYRERAESFNALAAKREELAEHLLWLNETDRTDKKEHFAYFESVLKAANAGLAQSQLFTAIGTERTVEGMDADPFTAKVEEIRVQRFAAKPYAEGFAAAHKAASVENPQLAYQYVVKQRMAGERH